MIKAFPRRMKRAFDILVLKFLAALIRLELDLARIFAVRS